MFLNTVEEFAAVQKVYSGIYSALLFNLFKSQIVDEDTHLINLCNTHSQFLQYPSTIYVQQSIVPHQDVLTENFLIFKF